MSEYKTHLEQMERAKQHAIDARNRLATIVEGESRENDPLLVNLLKKIGADEIISDMRRQDGMMVEIQVFGQPLETHASVLYGAAQRAYARQKTLSRRIAYQQEYWQTQGVLDADGKAVAFSPSMFRTEEQAQKLNAHAEKKAAVLQDTKDELEACRANVVDNLLADVADRLESIAQDWSKKKQR